MKKILFTAFFLLICSLSFAEELTGMLNVHFGDSLTTVIDKMIANGWSIPYVNNLEEFEKYYSNPLGTQYFYKPREKYFGITIKDVIFQRDFDKSVFSYGYINLLLEDANIKQFFTEIDNFSKHYRLKECEIIYEDEDIIYPYISANNNIFYYTIDKKNGIITLAFEWSKASRNISSEIRIKQ